MVKRFFEKAETGKLIVSGVMLCVEPTGVAATLFGLDAAIETRNNFFKKQEGLAALASELEADFNAQLKTKAYDKPADARQVLPDMLKIALSDPSYFVIKDLDPEAILKLMIKRFDAQPKGSDCRRHDIQSAFRRLYEPLLTTACNDPRLKAALDSALYRDQRQEQREMAKDIKQVMRDVEGASSAKLREVADFFKDAPGRGATDFELMTFLKAKAEDVERLSKERDALPNDLPRLANLSAEVTALIDDYLLDEAEELLDGARDILKQENLRPILEANAKLDEQKADILILRGDLEAAFRVLNSAADSFGAIDFSEPGRRKWPLATKLQRHGIRYGGQGLRLCDEMCTSALALLNEKDHPRDFAAAHNTKANALQHQGTRTAGPEGAALLAEAVDSYRAALRVRTEAEHPVDWAMTMQNLAGALELQGTRTAGPEGAALLAEAVDSYRAALRVRTEAEHPVDWAMTMQNLAGALELQGTRTAGPEGAALLAEAVDSYRAALRVSTEAEHPVHWATTMQNLAIALELQGTRTAGPARAALLAEAVDSYRAALRVRTEAEHPVQWATTTQNLAGALQQQGTRTAGPEGAALLAEAVDSLRAALRVFTEAEHPVHWAMSQENLAIAEEARAQHDTSTDPRPHLEAALVHVDNALRVYDPDHMAYDYGTATALRDTLQAALDALPSSSS